MLSRMLTTGCWKPSNHPSILPIHEHNSQGYFKFQPINQVLVEKLLLDINVQKSCGHDTISPRLLKESAAVIARPMANIINSSISRCRYPASWKMGQVTSLFKQDDELSKANYRPVTVLPGINNIYESILVVQLKDFYSFILSDFISSYKQFHSCETSLLRMMEEWRWWWATRGDSVNGFVKGLWCYTAPTVISQAQTLRTRRGQLCPVKRQQRVKIGDTFSSWETVERGCLRVAF